MLILAFLIGTSFADDSDEKIIYKQKTEIDFEGVEIEGQLVKPSASLIDERRLAKFNPLIKLRTDFNIEMKSSVGEVK